MSTVILIFALFFLGYILGLTVYRDDQYTTDLYDEDPEVIARKFDVSPKGTTYDPALDWVDKYPDER